jgi:hypothetical protein
LVERRELWRTRADGQAELVAHLPTYRPAGAGATTPHFFLIST